MSVGVTGTLEFMIASQLAATHESYRDACRRNPTPENLEILREFEGLLQEWIDGVLPIDRDGHIGRQPKS